MKEKITQGRVLSNFQIGLLEKFSDHYSKKKKEEEKIISLSEDFRAVISARSWLALILFSLYSDHQKEFQFFVLR